MGRRRRLPAYLLQRRHEREMSWDERGAVREADRMAKNSPIQAFSSDIGFLGACLFSRYIEQNDRSWRIQNVVHDSCVYQVPIAQLRESIEVAERCFTRDVMRLITEIWSVEWNCPLEIDFEFGLRWGGLTKWDWTDADFDRIVTAMAVQ
jgi:DNA polymerase I-like protein with 3'-5' exonuclease and polymerase domains